MLRLLPRRGLHRLAAHWRPLTLGVQCLIEDGDTVLLVRHSYVEGWHFPGGGVQGGETVEQAALRELREEAGLVPDGSLALVSMHYNPVFSRLNHVAFLRGHGRSGAMRFRPSLEIEDAGFFPRHALPDGLAPGPTRRLAELDGLAPVSPTW